MGTWQFAKYPLDEQPTGNPHGQLKSARLNVLWLAHDEVSFHGLPALLDLVPVIAAYQVCQDTGTVMAALRGGSFDVYVFPLGSYSQRLGSLVPEDGGRLVLTLCDSAAPHPGYLAQGRVVDAWLLEQRITLGILRETFAQLAGSAPVSRRVAGPGPGHRATRAMDRLTSRELSVLRLLVQGQSNQQIARALGISIHGVKRHVSSLLLKFDCSNRTEVALAATRIWE